MLKVFNLSETAIQDENTLIITYLDIKILKLKRSIIKTRVCHSTHSYYFELNDVQVNGENPILMLSWLR
jgi:hypothetical protein